MSGAAVRLAYKPVGLVLGVAASAASGVIFRQIWKRISGGDSAPEAHDPTRDWAEVLLAAALQGAIYAFVRAAVDRAAAVGVARATGDWPTRDRKPTRVKVPI
ncbi:MAG: DUF4235 domain-containing protein [Micromonosporaceae bacterium]|nr:DUF4235 domain-containing protein [Micromonosporaceae bacterium]